MGWSRAEVVLCAQHDHAQQRQVLSAQGTVVLTDARDAPTGAVMSAQIHPANNAKASVVIFDNDLEKGFSFHSVKRQRAVRRNHLIAVNLRQWDC